MADDTRQSPSQPLDDEPVTNALSSDLERRRALNQQRRSKYDPSQTQAGKLWSALGPDPNAPVNEMPGGTYNTAGGRPKEVSWRDAFDFGQLNPNKPPFYQTSCGKNSLLVGMGAGASVGGVSLVFRGLSAVLLSSNLAVGAFTLTASGMYYWCTQRQFEEAKGMAIAVAGMKRLNEKKKREKMEALEQLRRAEEEEKARSWTNKIKFW